MEGGGQAFCGFGGCDGAVGGVKHVDMGAGMCYLGGADKSKG